MRSARAAVVLVAASVAAAGLVAPAAASSSQDADIVETAVAAGEFTTSQDADIVETAVAAGEFTTLTKLLKRAGLRRALKKPGPYTVFAPTDAAFADVPQRKLDALVRKRKKLRSVLLYHVLGRELTAAEVTERRSARTLNGKKVRFRVKGSDVRVNRATVTAPDVTASNGVIHVIDRVLLPR